MKHEMLFYMAVYGAYESAYYITKFVLERL